jgi:hypothetical protein
MDPAAAKPHPFRRTHKYTIEMDFGTIEFAANVLLITDDFDARNALHAPDTHQFAKCMRSIASLGHRQVRCSLLAQREVFHR